MPLVVSMSPDGIISSTCYGIDVRRQCQTGSPRLFSTSQKIEKTRWLLIWNQKGRVDGSSLWRALGPHWHTLTGSIGITLTVKRRVLTLEINCSYSGHYGYANRFGDVAYFGLFIFLKSHGIVKWISQIFMVSIGNDIFWFRSSLSIKQVLIFVVCFGVRIGRILCCL